MRASEPALSKLWENEHDASWDSASERPSMSTPTSARIAPLLDAAEALRWLDRGSGGALAIHVMRAKGGSGGRALKCAPTPAALGLLHEALGAALAMGASRALLWQLDGIARPGEAIAIAGAVAEHRAEAGAAVERLLQGLKGVATRDEL